MAAIDIGPGATDRSTANALDTYTVIDLGNPANDNGVLTSFEIWLVSNGAGLKFGTFYGTGATRTCRDYEIIGAVTGGSKQTFTGLHCDVQTNDLLGRYATTQNYEADDTGGDGYYYNLGDQFGEAAFVYNTYGDYSHSVYATGSTGWTGTICVGKGEIVNPAAVRLGTQELTAAQISKIVLGKGEI